MITHFYDILSKIKELIERQFEIDQTLTLLW